MKRLCLFLALGLALVGCDSGDTGEEPTQDVTPQTDNSNEGDTPALGACGDLDLTGNAFRVTKLLGIKPTDMVNEVWAKDISTYDLVLLVRVVEYDPANKRMVMAITSAKAEVTKEGETITPVSYTYALEPAQFETRLDGCTFFIEDPIALSINTPTVSKPFTVFGVTGKGTFTEDGQGIKNVTLKGAIEEEESTDLCMMLPGVGNVNFHWFMNMAHICPAMDSDGDEVMDAYEFEGRMEGVNETEFYKEGIDPMTTLVTECKVDTEPCK